MLNLKRPLSVGLLASLLSMASTDSKAQLSSNPDKFLGNITTSYNVDYGSEKYYTLWNQITCENESKWASIEGNNNSFNWNGSDNAFNYAKSHNFPFKFHALIWGAQYPSWLEKQTPEQRYKEIVQWMDEVKKHYPNLQLIDVVNEAITGHQPGTPYFIEALGGTGKSGYDWLIKAFELAYERWPNAILIYNDFNTFQWNTDQYIDLVKTLRDAGAPIDAYGCQSHDLTDCSLTNFKNSMTKLQSSLKMPMYSTEYDIGTDDDNLQLQRYKEQIPYMWESDYVAGITLWGYIHGRTWTTNGNSGIIKDGKDRPAMTWLREYMKTDAAKNAKSPFPGFKKEASVYIKPSSVRVEKDNDIPVEVRAKLITKSIERVELYSKNVLVATMTEAPYITDIHAATTGRYDLKAIVYATDGTKYERYGGFNAYNPRKPYKTINLPGIMQAEDFDSGAEGIAYHDTDNNNQGTSAYRTTSGVDVVDGASTGSYSIGYTSAGEWLEYTVNVKEAGIYSFDAYVSANEPGASITLSLSDDGKETPITGKINVPSLGWNSYRNVHGRTTIALEEGQQVIRLNIASGSCNVDKITFKKIDVDESMNISLKVSPSPATVSTPSTVSVTASSSTSTIKSVKVYANDVLVKETTAEPYEVSYTPTAKGTVKISAFATDEEGKVSKIVSSNVTVQNKRSVYRTVTLPGTIEAENFDKGGEGLTFHDSDTKNEGDATSYRSDAEGMDIVKITNGYAIGYTAKGEWMEYTVNVKEAGSYTYEATVAAGGTGGSFAVSYVVDGRLTTLASVTVPQTASNSWTTYKVVKGRISRVLQEGEYRIRISVTGPNFNLDKFTFVLSTPLGIDDVENDIITKKDNDAIYNLRGQKVDENYKGVVIKNGKKLIIK